MLFGGSYAVLLKDIDIARDINLRTVPCNKTAQAWSGASEAQQLKPPLISGLPFSPKAEFLSFVVIRLDILRATRVPRAYQLWSQGGGIFIMSRRR
jgi:hypothetical protein